MGVRTEYVAKEGRIWIADAPRLGVEPDYDSIDAMATKKVELR